MYNNRAFVIILVLISALAFAVPLSVFAAGAAPAPAAPVNHKLTQALQVEVKSIVNERVPEGTRIGAVIRLFNHGSRIAVVPEYEVRVKTTEAIEYTLRPSASNVRTIQPKEKVELSYMVTVSRSDSFTLKRISWVDVDEYVYPKKEKTVLTVLISAMEWRGERSDPKNIKAWGQPFTLPVYSPTLSYTPVTFLEQNSSEGPISVLTLYVENNGKMAEWIPDFRIHGKANGKIYIGRRVDRQSAALEPGRAMYIHYVIPNENKIRMNSLHVLTPETFVNSDETEVIYTVGRLQVQLPSNIARPASKAEPYKLMSPVRFEPFNKLIGDAIEVSLVELHLLEGEGAGYKTAVARFALNNRSGRPVSIPKFEAELLTSAGSGYAGTRQSIISDMLMPNLSYVISYSFNVPNSERSEDVTINLLDGQTAAPFNITIASLLSRFEHESSDKLLSVYPFDVTLKNWMGYINMISETSHSYKLELDLEIVRQENVVVDPSFTKMRIDLVDPHGRILGSQSFPFIGEGRLVHGMQTVEFEDVVVEELEETFYIHIYEAIDTPNGEVKRLVEEIKQ